MFNINYCLRYKNKINYFLEKNIYITFKYKFRFIYRYKFINFFFFILVLKVCFNK